MAHWILSLSLLVYSRSYSSFNHAHFCLSPQLGVLDRVTVISQFPLHILVKSKLDQMLDFSCLEWEKPVSVWAELKLLDFQRPNNANCLWGTAASPRSRHTQFRLFQSKSSITVTYWHSVVIKHGLTVNLSGHGNDYHGTYYRSLPFYR